MMPFNPMMILQALNQGADPNQLTSQLAQQYPAVRQAMQLMSGKTPKEIQKMCEQRAQQYGVNIHRLLRQWGIPLSR